MVQLDMPFLNIDAQRACPFEAVYWLSC